jgi:hypothetical protein
MQRVSLCVWCRHAHRPIGTCGAYPDGVPRPIRFGEAYHFLPAEGDQGIQFEPAEDISPAGRAIVEAMRRGCQNDPDRAAGRVPEKPPHIWTDEEKAKIAEMLDKLREAGILRAPDAGESGELPMRMPLCVYCKHKHGTEPTCDAYPHGIPRDFRFAAQYHVNPAPDDRGIQFELLPDLALDVRAGVERIVDLHRQCTDHAADCDPPIIVEAP